MQNISMTKQCIFWAKTAILVSLLASTTAARAQLLPPPPLRAPPRPPDSVMAISEGKFPLLLPLRNSEDANTFYGSSGLSTLGAVLVSGWSDRGSIYAELLHDTLGPVRLSFGSAVALAKQEGNSGEGEEPADDDISGNAQRFFAGGGLGTLMAVYPLAIMYSQSQPGNRLLLYALPKISADLPVLGVKTDKFGLNGDLGFELHGQLLTDNEIIGLFGQARVAWVGGNQSFFQGLGRTTDFTYVQWTAGVQFKNVVQIAVSGIRGPQAVMDAFGPVTLGVSVVAQRR